MGQIETYKYSWHMFDDDVKTILNQVDFSDYDLLVGIAKGGLPLLTKLSNASRLPYEIIKCSSYEANEQKELQVDLDAFGIESCHKILLIDDVADTGKTLDVVSKYITDAGIKCETLTLCYKPHSVIVPTWYVREVPSNLWIDFAWE